MKKVIFMAVLMFSFITATKAQNDTVFYLHENMENVEVCINNYDRALVYADESCTEFIWWINYYEEHTVNPIIITPEMGYMGSNFCPIEYDGCGKHYNFIVSFTSTNVPPPGTFILWKHQGESIQIEAVGADSLGMYNYYWSTGETTYSIDVTEDVTYTCEISDMCGTAIRTFPVKDNVELYRATVDLETKLNKVTWQTTPEQAEYISEVKVERDGMVVGTAPYEQGYFMDNIGSENAARNYRLIAITTEGTECPIPSYQKGTLHVDYSPNASNPNKLNMAWTPPLIEEGAPIAVSYFQICKYDPTTSEVTVIDQIGANNTIGSYDVDLFDEGYAVVAAMFNEGKDYEELAFSNLTDFLVGIEENEGQQCRVYPNPAKDRFTVEGTGTMTITNTLGQTVLTKEIDGKATIELPQGLYFVKLGGTTRKIVVE